MDRRELSHMYEDFDRVVSDLRADLMSLGKRSGQAISDSMRLG